MGIGFYPNFLFLFTFLQEVRLSLEGSICVTGGEALGKRGKKCWLEASTTIIYERVYNNSGREEVIMKKGIMAHISFTYHIVWRTKSSLRTITEKYETELYAYILGICKNKKCTLLRINSMPDHLHMCVEIHPTLAVSEFVQVVKQESSHWLKEQRTKFPYFEGWGNGYAAFTYSASERSKVVEYIRNQKIHHQKKSFREEYEGMLIEFGLDPEADKFLAD